MAKKLPPNVAESDLSRDLNDLRAVRKHQGKARDTYEVEGHSELIMPVTTDRFSAFDFVLNATAPGKGKNLVKMSVFWMRKILPEFPNHLVAAGSEIDAYLPPKMRAWPELQQQALIVRRLDMILGECIVRGYLTGSGWKSYQKDGTVWG